MQKSLIATLLATFSKEERRDFAHFLNRPERSVRKDVKSLAGLLLKQKQMTAEATFDLLYPEQPFSRQQINQLGSWLYTEARAFLLEQYHAATNDEFPLVMEFDRRNLRVHRDRLLRQLRKKDLHAGATFALESAIYDTTNQRDRTGETNLQAMDDALDKDYLRRKLRQACLMQSHRNVAVVAYDQGLLPQVLAFIEAKRLEALPEIGVYYHAYRFLQDPEAANHFSSFQSLLAELPTTLPGEELRDLYLLGINFCIRLTNQGDTEMAREALRLYREGLTNGALLENGWLSPFTYRNAVALSLKIRDFGWARDFIEHYASALPPEQREELPSYNRARLAHAMGRPEEALEALRYVRSNDVLFTLTMDTLRAKIYYETEAHDLLSAHLDKMQIFLRRKGDSYHHKNYANFIALLRKILHLRPRPNEKDQLRASITQEAMLTERRWLLEKLSDSL